VFSGPHYAPNSLEAGALPRTPLGKLTTLPRAPKLDRERTQACGHPFPFPSPLDAIGVSLSVCGTLAPQLAKNCPGTWNGNSAPLAELLFLAHSVEMKPTTSMCVTAMAVCDVSTCLLQSADLSLSVVQFHWPPVNYWSVVRRPGRCGWFTRSSAVLSVGDLRVTALESAARLWTVLKSDCLPTRPPFCWQAYQHSRCAEKNPLYCNVK